MGEFFEVCWALRWHLLALAVVVAVTLRVTRVESRVCDCMSPHPTPQEKTEALERWGGFHSPACDERSRT